MAVGAASRAPNVQASPRPESPGFVGDTEEPAASRSQGVLLQEQALGPAVSNAKQLADGGRTRIRYEPEFVKLPTQPQEAFRKCLLRQPQVDRSNCRARVNDLIPRHVGLLSVTDQHLRPRNILECGS